MGVIDPQPFSMKDLYLDVSLTACIDGSTIDFTGRKTFSTGFFRAGIGFGITAIDIEIGTSLQPVIDITFKDLYGNTMFGTQRGENNVIDTSVLFKWPPPKFIFEFKGFLGKKVKWILNLKTIDVTYISSDGSYEIKCSFVPNQWGFFADIPFLYLVGLKKLRKDYYGNNATEDDTPCGEPCANVQGKSLTNIFSLIKVGKQVDVKTEEKTKDFDSLTAQLTAMKNDASYAIYNSKIIKTDEPITGEVNGILTKGFLPISFPAPDGYGTPDEIATMIKGKDNITEINTYLLANMKKGTITGGKVDEKYNPVNVEPKTKDAVTNAITKNEAADLRKNALSIISDNIDAINNEIKRRVYNSSKSKIRKLTISEVFRQLAKDTAFITGRILEAGLEGYLAHKEARDKAVEGGYMIGKCFPLKIEDTTISDIKGADNKQVKVNEEVPATQPVGPGGSLEVNVKDHELKFVDEFITAISEGVAENLIEDDLSLDPDKLAKRVNNLEMLKGNPYKSSYINIIENVLIRSGVAGYITRNSDPNLPGSYKTKTITTVFDSKNSDEDGMDDLAKLDLENITDSILGALSFEDKQRLKKFCTYFSKGFNSKGDRFLDYNEQELPFELDKADMLSDVSSGTPTEINEFLKIFPVVYLGESPSSLDLAAYKNFKAGGAPHLSLCNGWEASASAGELIKSKTLTQAEAATYINLTGSTVQNGIPASLNITSLKKLTVTLSDILVDLQIETSKEKATLADSSALINASYINPKSFTASLIKNNGVYYSIPPTAVFLGSNGPDPYMMIMFEGDTANDLKGITSSPTDGTFTADDQKERGLVGTEYAKPKGVVVIEGATDEKDKLKPEVKTINEYINKGLVLKYSTVGQYENNVSDYEWKVTDVLETDDATGYSAKGLAYTVYGEYNHEDKGLVFGPFANCQGGKNQRIFLKVICQGILEKFDAIETKQREIIGAVLGKAGEEKNAIYKQMHNIFNQWESIASVDSSPCGDVGGSAAGLAGKLEEAYGKCCSHLEKDPKVKAKDIVENDSTLVSVFRYDYPLKDLNLKDDIKVKNSIINIEPLYKANANSTVLSMIQLICTKNHFIFVPFPGDINYDNIAEVFNPSIMEVETKAVNFFHVMFAPTPETRTDLGKNTLISDFRDAQRNIVGQAIGVKFGSTDNQIFKNVSVNMSSTKPTAESILNLQRLADNETKTKSVITDCSMLTVYEGRSYTATIDMLGNAQVYPMQYFFIDNMPLFGGLYQAMKVKHSITPNDMTTSVEGMRMRFDINNGYGGVHPITLETLDALGDVSTPLQKSIVLTANVTPFDPNEPSGGNFVNAGQPTLGNTYSQTQTLIVDSVSYPAALKVSTSLSDKTGLIYFNQKTEKKYIVLHHTAGRDTIEGTIATFVARSKPTNKVSTTYVVDSKGTIAEVYPPQYWSYHASEHNTFEHSTYSIGIEITSWGFLGKGGYFDGNMKWIPKTAGVFYNYGGGAMSNNEVATLKKPFKGNYFFHKYTKKQMIALLRLVVYLSRTFNIAIDQKLTADSFNYSIQYEQSRRRGVYFHANVNTGKTDLYPDEDFIKAYNRLIDYIKVVPANATIEDILKLDFNELFT